MKRDRWEWGDYPRISRWIQGNHELLLGKGRRVKSEESGRDEAEVGMMQTQAEEYRQLLDAGQGKERSSRWNRALLIVCFYP